MLISLTVLTHPYQGAKVLVGAMTRMHNGLPVVDYLDVDEALAAKGIHVMHNGGLKSDTPCYEFLSASNVYKGWWL